MQLNKLVGGVFLSTLYPEGLQKFGRLAFGKRPQWCCKGCQQNAPPSRSLTRRATPDKDVNAHPACTKDSGTLPATLVVVD